MPLRDMRLKWKISLLITFTSALVLGVCGIAFYFYEVSAIRAQIVNDFATTAQMTAANSTAAVAFKDKDDARETLSALGNRKAVRYAYIYDQDGNILASYFRADAVGVAAPAPTFEGHVFMDDELHFVQPVTQSGQRLGSLYIVTDLSPLHDRIGVYAKVVALVVALGVILSLILATQVQRVISEPITRLSDTARAVSATKDYSLRATSQGGDEIGQLTEQFNGMLAQVQQRDKDRVTTQSEIEHLNNELRQRIDELQTLFDVAPIGIAVARDVDCKRIDVNPAGASILGISRERNASTSGDAQPFKVFKDGREVPNAELPMQAAATTGNQIANVEYEIHRTDGETINLLEYASPLRDERGRLRGSLGVWVDVTAYKKTEADLRKAREQAERLSRVKDEFLATLSHELRTPLTPILGWVRMIRSGNLQAAEVDRGMGIIERNVVTQTSLIEDLLDISRIIAGKLKLEPRRVVLASAADAALDAVKHSADSKNVQLKIDADRGVVVLGDHSRLQQIIWNLLTNAVKFTPRGGTVSMQIRGSDDRAVVRVTDSGEGIDADYLPHVFDRFSQFDGSTTRRHGGLGLGLSIVKHLVELHGGTVQAYSEGRGKGATFEVALTRVLDAGADVEARGLEQQLEDKRTLLKDVALLVVDDEVDTRLFLERALSLFGAKVDSAANASDAIQKFATHRFELVVSDIGMPDEDGYALLKKIRGIDRSVPVLALTAFARPQDRDRTLQEGFDHYLAKPVDPTELATMIAGLLLRKRQAKA